MGAAMATAPGSGVVGAFAAGTGLAGTPAAGGKLPGTKDQPGASEALAAAAAADPAASCEAEPVMLVLARGREAVRSWFRSSASRRASNRSRSAVKRRTESA